MRCGSPVVLAFVWLASAPSSAAVWSVTKTADTRDGTCDADCSLREAVIAANANPGDDTILIPAGTYTFSRAGADDAASVGDLDVTGATTLSGAGSASTTISANGLDRVLDVDPGAAGISVTVSGVTLRDGSSAFGGGILNRGTLRLEGCVVSGHRARNGGGLLNLGEATLVGTTLSDDRATTSGSADGFGGALFNAPGASATLTDVTLSENQADRDGGALFNHTASLSISGGAARDNTAGASGGAAANSGSMTVDGTAWERNVADDGGAIASLSGSQLLVQGASFHGNEARGLDLGGGGALFLYGASATLTDSVLEENVAYGEGGGAIESLGALVVSGGRIRDNLAVRQDPSQAGTAFGFGGGLLLIAGSQVTLSGVEIAANRAGRTGGAIYLDRDAALTVQRATLSANVAESGHGGAVSCEGAASIQDSTLAGNQAGENGGGLALAFGSAELQRSRLTGNQAAAGGGGLYTAPGTTATLVATALARNVAGSFGGGLLGEGAVSARDGAFEDNRAQTGAGLFAQAGSEISVTKSGLTGNVASVNGGAVWNEGRLTLVDAELAGNVGDFGGALGNRAGTVRMRRVGVRGNTARVQGGGAYNFEGGSLELVQASVTENVSQGQFGGGIANEASLVVEQSTIAENSAPVAGGGLFNNGAAASATLRSVTVSRNEAPEASAWWNYAAAGSVTNAAVVGTCKSDAGSLSSLGGNLESPGSTCGFSQPSDRSHVADAGLGPLLVGGFTASSAPEAGSPLIDTGLACAGADQRGAPRPRDGDGDGQARCDVGAIEVPEPGSSLPAVIALLALARCRRRAR